jgi:hypothetical protein
MYDEKGTVQTAYSLEKAPHWHRQESNLHVHQKKYLSEVRDVPGR